MPSGYAHFEDPQVYYTQHLRGFIRGGTVAKNEARNTLQGDLRAIAPGNAVVKRDVALLEQVGSKVASSSYEEVTDAYATALENGSPDAAALTQLKASLQEAVGTAVPSTTKAINKLVADAPAFFQGAGSSANVETLLNDVGAYVAAGGSAPLNPFRVQVVRQGGSAPA